MFFTHVVYTYVCKYCYAHSYVCTYVTGSAKTRHNRASLNFQYKALNAMGEILAYFEKYYGIFFECLVRREGNV